MLLFLYNAYYSSLQIKMLFIFENSEIFSIYFYRTNFFQAILDKTKKLQIIVLPLKNIAIKISLPLLLFIFVFRHK